jgi:signal transduction histidine kinase
MRSDPVRVGRIRPSGCARGSSGDLPGAEHARCSGPYRREVDDVLRRGRQPLLDQLGTVVAMAFAAADLAVNQPGTRADDGWSWAIWVVQAVALAGRRRAPLLAGMICVAGVVTWAAMGHIGELLNLPGMVALYLVATEGSRRRSAVVGAVAVVLGGVGTFVGSHDTSPVLDAAWPIVPLLLGEVVRQRRELRDEHLARVEAEAAASRARLARDVHDVVAHTMAAVNVQMGVALAAFDSHPETAREALVTARSASRDALGEIRTAIALLREGGSEPTGPAPGLDDLPALAAGVEAAGVRVDLAVDGADPSVGGVVALTAYRVVQEALTNVLRHSGAGTAVVRVGPDADGLLVEVRDDGVGPGSGAGGGLGLVGMGERVTALGGRIDHGAGADGGFVVRAWLPRTAEVIP